MTEQKIENNWLNNIVQLMLEFVASWLFVRYIRIYILEIPYATYYGFSYDSIASFVCVALLFLLYKKVPLKVSSNWQITGFFFCFLVLLFTTRAAVLIVMDWVNTVYHPYVETAYFYAYLFFAAPLITYLLAFINKKVYITVSWIYITLIVLSLIYWLY